jgi:hypothetical protein
MRVLTLIFAAGCALGAAGVASATPAPAALDPSFLNGVQSDYMRRGGHARAARAYRGRRVAGRRAAYTRRAAYHRRAASYRRAAAYRRAGSYRRAAYYRRAAHYRRAGYHRRYGHYRPYRSVRYYPAYGYRHYRHRRCYYRWHPVFGNRLVCKRRYRPHVYLGF